MENITSNLNGGLLTIAVAGRVDTNNADAVEKDINSICAENPYDSLVLDFENLEYISSAGLRVLLRLRKANADLKVINVSSEVYDVFEMTGFTEMITVEKAYRKFSVEGCKIIGKGAKGTVYRYDDETIIKVYNDLDSLPSIQRERELARRAFVLGIPTAISYDVVTVDGKYGSVFELLDAKSYSQLIAENPDKLEEYIKSYASLLKQIHETPVKADDMPDVKILINKWLETDQKYLSEEDFEKLDALVRNTPDTLNMLHGDYHTNNIMMQNDETLLIDMDTLSHGHPIFELASVYITYVGFSEADPKNVEDFLGFSCDLARKAWDIFLPAYLGTDNPGVLEEVTNKAKLLSYTRLLRHTVRRAKGGNEPPKAIVDLCVNGIHTLVNEITNLDF